MEPALAESTAERAAKNSEVENKVLEILREKCKRVLLPRTEEDNCYGIFLEVDGFMGLNYIKLKTTDINGIKIFGRGFYINMELKDQIYELQTICLKWNSSSLEWKMLNISLLDRYDFIRSNINKSYSRDIKDPECKAFIENMKNLTRELDANSLGIKSESIPKNKKKRPVYQLCKETGIFIARHESITAAGKAVGTKHISRINECCSGTYESACGYKWEYAD